MPTPTKITRRHAIALTTAAAAAPALAPAPAAAHTEKPWSERKQYEKVNGLKMAYIDTGVRKSDSTFLFLHGNPTSSYLWRNVMPHVEDLGRCVAPDLIGMGDSAKLPDSGPGAYTYLQHREYLGKLLEQLDLGDDVTLVIHDWGSGLGFDWAYRNQDRVRGICYMEALMRPPGDGKDIRPSKMFEVLRTERGDQMVLEDNMFIERMLLGDLGYYLSEEDKAEYRRPFAEPGEARRPTLTWPRELVIEGEPAENDKIIRAYSKWLSETDKPKLFIQATPGAISQVKPLLQFASSLPNQTKAKVHGGHFVQEVSPHAIGRALREWWLKLGDSDLN